MPLEIKTGKPSFSSEHRGQVIIYQMMMSAVGQKVENGLLLYLRFVFGFPSTSLVLMYHFNKLPQRGHNEGSQNHTKRATRPNYATK